MNKIIINADDFGKSKEINFAIIAAIDLNLCLDTTLLVNFEDSSHAAGLAVKNNRKNNVGIHLNLTQGYPLTENIKKERRFCNNLGHFHYKKDKRIICLSTSEKRAVLEELTSQIKLCRSFGIPISHADSHNHIHEEPGMLMIILHILNKENIPFVRMARNIGKTHILNKIYRNAFNSVLSYNNLVGINYFGSTSDFRVSKRNIIPNSITELMVHPGKIINNNIFDSYSGENLNEILPEIITGNILISYCQLKK